MCVCVCVYVCVCVCSSTVFIQLFLDSPLKPLNNNVSIVFAENKSRDVFHVVPLVVRCLWFHTVSKHTVSSSKEPGAQPLPLHLPRLNLHLLLWNQALLFLPLCHHGRKDLVTPEFRECLDARLYLDNPESMQMG